LPQRALAIRSG
jgi:hypothetical protein